MSEESYNSIPPERRDEYLRKAEEAFNEVAQEPVDKAVQGLGGLVVRDAENLTKAHADAMAAIGRDADELTRAHEIGDQAQQYVDEHGMTEGFREELNDIPGRLAQLDAAGQVKGNPLRGDKAPAPVGDLNMQLARTLDNEERADGLNALATVQSNGPRPDLPGADFQQALNHIGNAAPGPR